MVQGIPIHDASNEPTSGFHQPFCPTGRSSPIKPVFLSSFDTYHTFTHPIRAMQLSFEGPYPQFTSPYLLCHSTGLLFI